MSRVGNRPTVNSMILHLKTVNASWDKIGLALGVPLSEMEGIKSSNPHDGVSRWMTAMIQYWLNTNPGACWEQVVTALEQVDLLYLASTIKQQYLWDEQPPTDEVNQAGSTSLSIPPPTADFMAEVNADVEIVRQLRALGSKFSGMLTDCRQCLLASCDIGRVKFFLSQLLKTNCFDGCDDIEAILDRLTHKHISIFNVYPLEELAMTCLGRDDVNSLIQQYIVKKDKFLKQTTVLNFQKALVNQTKPALSKDKVEVTITVEKKLANDRVLEDMELLADEVFEDNRKLFINFHAVRNCVLIMWHAPEILCETLEQLVHQKTAILRENGVEKVTIGGKCVFTMEVKITKDFSHGKAWYQRKLYWDDNKDSDEEDDDDDDKDDDKEKQGKISTAGPPGTPCTSRACAQVKRTQAAKINQLKSQLQLLGDDVTEKHVSTHIRLPKKEVVEQIEVFESLLKDVKLSHSKDLFSKALVMARKITAPELSISVPIDPSLTNNLSYEVGQATSYTSLTKSKYSTTTIAHPDMNIAVCEMPILEAGDRPISIITGLNGPWGVAVCKSGEIVVSENNIDQISVLKEGSRITKFGSCGSGRGQFNGPQGIAIINDDHILVADKYNHRIQMFTMEGEFVRSVGEEGNGPLQFFLPTGIAVGPSGLVFVLDSGNHRIQVLQSDLSLSHVFSSYGSELGQLDSPRDIACGSSDKIYVTDFGNHRVQIFSADGQFISSIDDRLFHPSGICVDSTDTVYVTDYNNTVSGFTSSGEFLSCLKSEMNNPRGINSTTGTMYVCDYENNRIKLYNTIIKF